MKRVLGSAAIIACMVTVCFSCHKNNHDTQTLSKTDKDFIDAAAHGNRAEITAGQIAADHGMDSSVMSFGMHMVNEHGESYDELKNISSSDFNYDIPQDPDSAHINSNMELMTLSGHAFDSTYINSQIADHIKTIALFENEANGGNSQDLRDYANKYLPHIKEHLAMADSIKARW